MGEPQRTASGPLENMPHTGYMPLVFGRFRLMAIASALLGTGLAVHGWISLYWIQNASAAGGFIREMSLGAMLMIWGGIFLKRKASI
jgi:hypothetical protein